MKRQRYENLDGISNMKSMADMRRWMRERRRNAKDLSVQIPQAEHKQTDFLLSNRERQTITWIGHSTFLIQMDGLNIVTDPVWARWMGLQKRLTEPGIPLNQMPDIDVVLISHGHYDHLDFSTLRRLRGHPLMLVPVGLKRLFLKKGFARVEEFAWWESHEVGALRFSFVPAQHWTRRSLFDTNSSHWGGWIIERSVQKDGEDITQESIYFVGDTGYFRGFRMIAERYEIDTILMPIGAYEPEWFMKDSHINPEDAVRAFEELGGKRFIPMHYGTYRLADDTGPEALDRLYREWDRRYDGNRDRLKVLKLGETIVLN